MLSSIFNVLGFLANWSIHLLFIASVILFALSLFLDLLPWNFVKAYKPPIKFVSLIFLLAMCYVEGATGREEYQKLEVAKLEKEVALAEQKAQEANRNINNNIVTKNKIIREKADEVIREIPVYITKDDDDKCVLPQSAVVLHDSASQNEIPPSAGSIAKGPSDVKTSRLLSTVIDNYATCYEIREQLKGWQEWYRVQKGIFEEVK